MSSPVAGRLAFGRILREYRERAGESRAAAAEAVGRTEQSYDRWEKEITQPPRAAQVKLAHRYNIPLELLDDVGGDAA